MPPDVHPIFVGDLSYNTESENFTKPQNPFMKEHVTLHI